MSTLTLLTDAEVKQAEYQARRAAYTDHVRRVIRERAEYEVLWWRIVAGVDVAVRDDGKG